MTKYEIIHTQPDSDTFSLFETVLEKIYTENVKPIKQTESINLQFLQQAYVILHNNQAIGRCCLYSNPHLSYQNYKPACIGNFEFINDTNAAHYFINHISSHARKLGFDYLIGPMNGSTWDTYRIAESYNTSNFFLEPYYPNYYTKLFDEIGFEKIARYVSNSDGEKELNEDRIEKIEQRFIEQGITFRNINLNNYDIELDKLYDFCMESFKSNFLFTPIDKVNFIEKYKKIKPFIKPDYVIIAEDKNKEMVGLIFCLENYNDKNEKGIIIKTLAKLPSMKYAGMGNVLTTQFKKKALQDGYKYIIHAFMIESNASKSLSNYFSGQLIREYFLYGKQL